VIPTKTKTDGIDDPLQRVRISSIFSKEACVNQWLFKPSPRNTPFSPRTRQLFARGSRYAPVSRPKSVKMSYGHKFGILFIARTETIVTAIQNNDLMVSAPMVRLSNAPPAIA